MAYLSKRERVGQALLELFTKNPTITSEAYERLEAELQVQFGISNIASKEILFAFRKTGRVKIEG